MSKKAEHFDNNFANDKTPENIASFIKATDKYRFRTIWLLFVVLVLCGIFGFFISKSYTVTCVFFVVALATYIVYIELAKVKVIYELDDYSREKWSGIQHAIRVLSGSSKIWQIDSSYSVDDYKTASGASSHVFKNELNIKKKTPRFIRTNEKGYRLKALRCDMYFLPDRIIVDDLHTGVLEYQKIKITYEEVNFIERDNVPSDANVADYSYKYVNTDGSPDKRYKDNPKIPVCKYAHVHLQSDSGLNTLLLVSNCEKAKEFCEEFIKNAQGIRINC